MTFKLKRSFSLWSAKWRGWGGDMPSAHQHLARIMKFDLERHSTQSLFQSPWSYHLPTLLLLDPGIDWPVTPAPNQRFVGPAVLRSPPRVQHSEINGRYFSDGRAASRIYAGFGSLRRPPAAFISRLIEIAERNPDWEILVAGNAAGHGQSDSPVNLRFVGWAPQLEALKLADCAIFHGGTGTLNECLFTGTPMLIYPNALDGKGNAARVVYHGLGHRGRYSDRTLKIERSISKLLKAEDVHARLQLISKRLQSQRRNQAAVFAIRELLDAPPPVNPNQRLPGHAASEAQS
ncbi:MAG: nucleotide disphospho-sugar-binding domain-containing protein [Pseudomonadota bacterium]